ncbi:MAG TPA: DUF1573 domain-containing protein [Bacteroidia bacterium]|jgi:hypothetical protein|nr:DUF1573 domain-containing protein [Bacteroidia bacterium]
MRKFLLPILILAFLLSVFSIIYKRRNNVVESTPLTKIRFSKKLIDIGDRIIKSPAEGKFTIYNIGPTDLLIENVMPDCHCTGAIFSKKAIKPNDSSEIILKYNSSIPGIFQSSALVTTNTSDSPLVLIFRGNIIDTTGHK